MARIVIVGATSGIGKCVAHEFIDRGWSVGIAGRRADILAELQAIAPDRVMYEVIDVMANDATERLENLISKLGGMDIFFLASGVGNQNTELNFAIESRTIATNILGFTQMIDTAYLYYKSNSLSGQIGVISSIAGTKGIGVAASYSASKRYQNIYIDALEQLAHQQDVKIRFTDIRPGFVKTALLNDNRKYPMQLTPEYVARHIVKSLLNHKRVSIIDWRYAIMVFFWRLIPRSIWRRANIANG
ncbi:MAG: SDR family NAD(P)-dependent oxidoreductase [Muribaculaceae bacterium]